MLLMLIMADFKEQSTYDLMKAQNFKFDKI
jgi:hypothetical protein